MTPIFLMTSPLSTGLVHRRTSEAQPSDCTSRTATYAYETAASATRPRAEERRGSEDEAGLAEDDDGAPQEEEEGEARPAVEEVDLELEEQAEQERKPERVQVHREALAQLGGRGRWHRRRRGPREHERGR